MGLFGDLFGSSIKSKSTMDDNQKAVSDQTAAMLQELLGGGATPYGGDLTVSSLPKQYTYTLNQMLRHIKPYFDKGLEGAALKNALSGQPSTTINQDVVNRYFQDAVVAPGMRTFDQEIAPRLKQGYVMAGGMSTRAGNALGRALEGVSTGMNANLAQTQLSMEQLRAQLAEAAANRQLQSIGVAQQLANAPAQAAQQYLAAILGIGGFNRQGEMANNQAAYQDWLRTQPENYLQAALGYTGQQHQQLYQQQGLLGQVAGAVGNLGMIGMAVL